MSQKQKFYKIPVDMRPVLEQHSGMNGIRFYSFKLPAHGQAIEVSYTCVVPLRFCKDTFLASN